MGNFSDILCEDNSMIFNEAYFGKTKELLAAEHQLDVFRNKYMGRYVLNMKVNSDPDLLEFDRMMEDIFGFGCFTIHVHNEMQANAFTMPIDFRIDVDSKVLADERGFKFNKDMDYACICGIYSGIIFNDQFTTPEVMAIILHEVGHNFNSAINKKSGVLVDFYKTLTFYINLVYFNIPNVVTSTNAWRKFVDKTGKKWRAEEKMPVVVYDAFMQIINFAKAGMITINDIARVFSMGSLTILSALYSFGVTMIKDIRDIPGTIIKIFSKKAMYNSELSADNFVTMYGYSSELGTALGKLGGKEGASASAVMKAFDNIPVVSTAMHFVEFPVYLLFGLLDEHPNDVSRVKDQMDMLNYELGKEDIDPKMKNIMKKDLSLCNEALLALVDISEGAKDPYLCRKLYNNLTQGAKLKSKLFGGKAARDKFEEYDKVFKSSSK